MLLLVGQVARETIGREAFQELDYRAVFGSMAKWVTQIDRAERVPELIARAFAVATSGRPGPVVVALPEDMLASRGRRARRRAAPAAGRPPLRPTATWRASASCWRRRARRWRSWARAAGRRRPAPTSPPSPRPRRVPVAASFRCQDYVDNASPAYAGHAGAGDGPGAGQAHPRGRPAAGHRRAPGRDPDRRLHARAPRRADPAPGPRASRPRRDRRRVPARAGDRRRPRGLRGRRPRARAGGRRRPRRAARGGARRVRAQPGRDARAARPAADVGRDGDAARAPARRGDPHQRRGQLQRVGAPLLRVPPLPDAARPAQRLDGLRRSRPRSPPRPCTPTAPWSASPATATS